MTRGTSMPSTLRGLRKVLGIVFILVNALLSLTSFLAVYSAIYFARDPNNYTIDTSGINEQLNAPVPFIYLGEVRLDNTGLFAFQGFTVNFTLAERNGTIISYDKNFGDIQAHQTKVMPLNVTAAEGAVLNMSMDFNPLTWVNVSASLMVGGKYAFGLFEFHIILSNLTEVFSP